MNVLITGGTGFVGKAVLARLVETQSYGTIYLLVRGRQGQTAAERVAGIVRKMFPPHKAERLLGRIHAVTGDLTQPGMGIGEEDLETMRGDVHQILHVGASTDFGAPLEESRLSNVEGTRHALDLAVELRETGVLRRFDYVSTAYVAGKTPGVMDEGDLDRRQEFSNSYEQSKYEAEMLVREYTSRLRIAIYRPSIVVGDSNSGYTPHFKVLYWPLLLLSKNLLPFFAVNQRAVLDVVPVDYVADGIVALMQREASIGGTFHLTAGLGNEIRIREFLKDSYKYSGIAARPCIPYWAFNMIWKTPLSRFFSQVFWDAVELARPYFAYFKGSNVRFDAVRTHETLAQLGIEPPRWDRYKREILTYCVASRWGKKLPMPEYIYYLPVSGRKDAPREYVREVQPGVAHFPVGHVSVGQNA
jgi:long-chain acyl-CoA synthetase